MRRFFDRIYHSAWGRVLSAGLVAAVLMAALMRYETVAYLTNDDNAIAFALAGYQTGAPYPYALFINCILGYLVSGLYTLLPSVPWWAALQLATLFCSMTAIGACLLRIFERRGAGPLLPVLLYGSLLLLLFVHPVVELTYTVTAAAAGAAGAALVIAAAGETKKKRCLLDLLGAMFVLVAFLTREETGFAALCFFALACACRIAAGPARKRALLLLCAVLALCSGAFLYNNAMQARVNGADYVAFFRYRERFTDYPRDTYAENPALYASAGWDKPLYDLADRWCFLDERVNADSLRTITEGSVHAKKTSLPAAMTEFLTLFETELPARFVAAAVLAMLFYAAYAFLQNGRRGGLMLLAALCSVGGACILCLYLCLNGRFLLRTFEVVALPSLVSAACYAAALPEPAGKRDRAVLTVLTVGLAAMALLAGGMRARALRASSPREQLSEMRAVNAYVLAHPDNVYFRDALTVNDYDAFTTYPDAKPTNLVSLGGCGMRSEAYRRQLAANGVTSPYADLLIGENVYVILPYEAPEQKTAYGTLLTYLRSTGLATELVLIERVGETFGVYRAE